MPESAVRSYRFGPYCLDPSRRTLTRDSKPVPIAGKAFDVLLVLLERRGQVVDKQELFGRVWPGAIVEEANLSQQIFMLRKLLGDGPERGALIVTSPKRGYGFFGEVQVEPLPGAARERAAEGFTARQDCPPIRLTIALPAEAPMAWLLNSVLAISPDGRRVVYVAEVDGAHRLYLRGLDSFDAHPIPGTEGAVNPFFSPDGGWIGFAAGHRLQRVPVRGGTPITICDLEDDVRGATWRQGDRIVFAPGPATGLWQVDTRGGTPAPLTTLDFAQGERTHRWPYALPDGRGVIFTIGSEGASSFDEGSLAVAEPEGSHRVVLYHGSDARYAPTGHLIYTRRSALLKTPFDLETCVARGSGRPVLSGVATSATGAGHFALSSNGTLVYATGEAHTVRRSLVAVGRDGTRRSVIVGGEGLEEPRLSPDGRRIVMGLRGRHTNLWMHDFAQAPLLRLTFEGDNFAAIWGPDGETITFSSNRSGACDLFSVRPDAGSAELLVASEFDKVPGCWTPDGSQLAFTEYHPETGADIWILERASGTARPLLGGRSNEYAPAVSPNGELLAYTSDESGRPEIYVCTLAGIARRWQLSVDGGAEPLWLSDAELVYRSEDRLMLVDLRAGPDEAAVPRTLFEGRYVRGAVTGLANYDRGPEPETLLMVSEDEPARPQRLSVVINWFGELTAKG